MGDDGIVLSDREREALAGLAEQIGDPWLARQLAGADAPPPPKERRFAGLKDTVLRATAGWTGALLLVAGAVLTVLMFTRSTLLGTLGLALMGFGAWRVAVDKGDDLILRSKTALQARQAKKLPRPPHTPPGAA